MRSLFGSTLTSGDVRYRAGIRGRTDGSMRLHVNLPQVPLASAGRPQMSKLNLDRYSTKSATRTSPTTSQSLRKLSDRRHLLIKRDSSPRPRLHSRTGRPSIGLELLVSVLLVGYCYVIRSERRLCEEVNLNLAYRRFCRLGLEGGDAGHSTCSEKRAHRRTP